MNFKLQFKSICFIALIVILFTGCSNIKEKIITISAETNFDENYVVSIQPIVTENSESKQDEVVQIDSNGVFTWEKTIEEPLWVQVTFLPTKKDRQLGASFPMFFDKSGDIQIKLNYSSTDYLSIVSGDIDGGNKSLIEYSAFLNKKMRDRFMRGPKNADTETMAEEYITYANQLISDNGVRNKQILEYMKVWSYNNFLEAVMNDNSYDISDIPDDLLTTLDSEWLFFYDEFSNLNCYFDRVVDSSGEDISKWTRLENKIMIIQESIKTAPLKENLLIQEYYEFINTYRITDIDSFNVDLIQFKELTKVLQNPEAEQMINSNLENLIFTVEGSDMPDVLFKDLDGNEVSLDQFKGRYIYIDLWASWCAPCLKEIPFLKEFRESYKDKNIEIVSISLDEDKDAWRKAVENHNLVGNSWEAGDSGFDKIMNVRGIPHFMLYGPDGKLIMYKAPRPSSQEIIDIFDKI